eukprot:1834614-Pyramimonas_sp.AAC.1
MLRILCGATRTAEFEVDNPLPAQLSHPPARNLACKSHVAAAVAMAAWRWLAHRCARASARKIMPRAAAS